METCFLALTLDQCSLTLVNFILTLENLGPRVNDSWDSDPSENPANQGPSVLKFCTLLTDLYALQSGSCCKFCIIQFHYIKDTIDINAPDCSIMSPKRSKTFTI